VRVGMEPSPRGTAQVAMSARAWDKIDYSRVASVCMKNNKKQFEVRLTSDKKPVRTHK